MVIAPDFPATTCLKREILHIRYASWARGMTRSHKPSSWMQHTLYCRPKHPKTSTYWILTPVPELRWRNTGLAFRKNAPMALKMPRGSGATAPNERHAVLSVQGWLDWHLRCQSLWHPWSIFLNYISSWTPTCVVNMTSLDQSSLLYMRKMWTAKLNHTKFSTSYCPPSLAIEIVLEWFGFGLILDFVRYCANCLNSPLPSLPTQLKLCSTSVIHQDASGNKTRSNEQPHFPDLLPTMSSNEAS